MEQRKQRQAQGGPNAPGAWIASITATISLGGFFVLLLHEHGRVMDAMLVAGMPRGRLLVGHVFPLLAGLGILAAAAWGVAAVGFWRRRRWAFGVAVAACLVCLLAGFFPTLPSARHGLCPSSVCLVFLPNLLAFLVLAVRLRRLSGWIVTLILMAALGSVFAFINGVACIHRLLGDRGMVYSLSVGPQFLVSAAWIVFALALTARRPWSTGSGVGAGFAAAVCAAPLALLDALSIGRFSLFAISPIYGLLVAVVLISRWPGPPLARWLTRSTSPAKLPGGPGRDGG